MLDAAGSVRRPRSSCVALVLGLLVGSFLNVVIYRLPMMLERQWRAQCAELARAGRRGAATRRPQRSRSAPLQPGRAALGLPALPGAITRAAEHPGPQLPAAARPLRQLRRRITLRYPLVELLHGLAVGAGRLAFGFGWPAPGGAGADLVPDRADLIDLDHQLLPDS